MFQDVKVLKTIVQLVVLRLGYVWVGARLDGGALIAKKVSKSVIDIFFLNLKIVYLVNSITD